MRTNVKRDTEVKNEKSPENYNGKTDIKYEKSVVNIQNILPPKNHSSSSDLNVEQQCINIQSKKVVSSSAQIGEMSSKITTPPKEFRNNFTNNVNRKSSKQIEPTKGDPTTGQKQRQRHLDISHQMKDCEITLGRIEKFECEKMSYQKLSALDHREQSSSSSFCTSAETGSSTNESSRSESCSTCKDEMCSTCSESIYSSSTSTISSCDENTSKISKVLRSLNVKKRVVNDCIANEASLTFIRPRSYSVSNCHWARGNGHKLVGCSATTSSNMSTKKCCHNQPVYNKRYNVNIHQHQANGSAIERTGLAIQKAKVVVGKSSNLGIPLEKKTRTKCICFKCKETNERFILRNSPAVCPFNKDKGVGCKNSLMQRYDGYKRPQSALANVRSRNNMYKRDLLSKTCENGIFLTKRKTYISQGRQDVAKGRNHLNNAQLQDLQIQSVSQPGGHTSVGRKRTRFQQNVMNCGDSNKKSINLQHLTDKKSIQNQQSCSLNKRLLLQPLKLNLNVNSEQNIRRVDANQNCLSETQNLVQNINNRKTPSSTLPTNLKPLINYDKDMKLCYSMDGDSRASISKQPLRNFTDSNGLKPIVRQESSMFNGDGYESLAKSRDFTCSRQPSRTQVDGNKFQNSLKTRNDGETTQPPIPPRQPLIPIKKAQHRHSSITYKADNRQFWNHSYTTPPRSIKKESAFMIKIARFIAVFRLPGLGECMNRCEKNEKKEKNSFHPSSFVCVRIFIILAILLILSLIFLLHNAPNSFAHPDPDSSNNITRNVVPTISTSTPIFDSQVDISNTTTIISTIDDNSTKFIDTTGSAYITAMETVLEMLDNVPLVDGHNDLPWNIRQFIHNQLNSTNLTNLVDEKPWSSSVWSHTDLMRLSEGEIGAQIWVAYAPCPSQTNDDVVEMVLEQIQLIKDMVNLYPDFLQMAKSKTEMLEAHASGRVASLISVESGHVIGDSLSILKMFHELGAISMTLTHSCNSLWADSSTVDEPGAIPQFNGLSDLGQDVIKEMNKLGMIIDLSHSSHKTAMDVIEISEAPVIFSHSSVFAICNSSRNVKDEALTLLAKKDGIIMINFYSQFLTCSNVSTIQDVIAHLEYVRSITGIDHIGIGASFDGINSTPVGLEDVSTYPDLFENLLKSKRWTVKELEKMAGLNFLRVFDKVEKVAKRLKSEMSTKRSLRVSNKGLYKSNLKVF